MKEHIYLEKKAIHLVFNRLNYSLAGYIHLLLASSFSKCICMFRIFGGKVGVIHVEILSKCNRINYVTKIVHYKNCFERGTHVEQA